MVVLTDSTIAPPKKTQRLCLTNVSWLLYTMKDTIETKVSIYFPVCSKAYRSMTSGCRGTPCFRRYGRELAGFETADFVEEKLGGLP